MPYRNVSSQIGYALVRRNLQVTATSTFVGLLSYLFAFAAFGQPEGVFSVTVRPVDSDGRLIDGANCVMELLVPERHKNPVCRGTRCSEVIEGQYRLAVTAPRRLTVFRRVYLSPRHRAIFVEMFPAKFTEPSTPRSFGISVVGPRDGELERDSVKIIGVYNDIVYSSSFDANGRADFEYLYSGRYHVRFFRDGRMICCKEVLHLDEERTVINFQTSESQNCGCK